MPPGMMGGVFAALQNPAVLEYLRQKGIDPNSVIRPGEAALASGQGGSTPQSPIAATGPSRGLPEDSGGLARSMPGGLFAPGGMVQPGRPIVRPDAVSALEGAQNGAGWMDYLKMGSAALNGPQGSQEQGGGSSGLQSAGLYMPNLQGLLQPLPAYANRSPLPGLFG